MTTFPSRIVSVRIKHFIAVLMERNLNISEQFLNECIAEAMKRENERPVHYRERELTLETIAQKLS